MGTSWLGGRSAEKDLGVEVAHKLNMSPQGETVTKEANIIPGCMHRSVVCQTPAMIAWLYAALVWPQLENCAQFWAL